MKPNPESPSIAHERTDAHVSFVLRGAGALAAGIGFSLAVAALLHRTPTSIPSPDLSFQHGAAETSSIARDWQEQDNAVRRHLGRYAWVDRKAGLVQIPIERAMELLAQPVAPPEKSR